MKAQLAHDPQLADTVVRVHGTEVDLDVYDLIVDILDRQLNITTLTTRTGNTILTWETTQQIATAIAGDPVLAQLFRRQGGGAV